MSDLNEQKMKKKEAEEQEMKEKMKKKKELEAREDMKGFIQWCIENKVYQHQRESLSGGASLTSTNFTPS